MTQRTEFQNVITGGNLGLIPHSTIYIEHSIELLILTSLPSVKVTFYTYLRQYFNGIVIIRFQILVLSESNYDLC